MIKISAVNYLNSKPFIHGLKNSGHVDKISLHLDIPSECARKLIAGEVDIGLVPIAAIPYLGQHNVITSYCIGADGPVNSVLLLSHSPLNKIRNVILDYQSKTSILLTKILFDQLWNNSPGWIDGYPGYESKIKGSTAGVVIGDRALQLKSQYPYCFDLSEAWKSLTGLPFVFACWISNTQLSPSFLTGFNKALKWGLDHKHEINTDNFSGSNIAEYLESYISYDLTKKKQEAMALFLKLSRKFRNK